MYTQQTRPLIEPRQLQIPQPVQFLQHPLASISKFQL